VDENSKTAFTCALDRKMNEIAEIWDAIEKNLQAGSKVTVELH